MTEAMAQNEAPTLYERLGGHAGLGQAISDIVDAHLANPTIRTRFEAFDAEKLKGISVSFFAAATGGPQDYNGRGLREVHQGMNLSEQEFVSATDDVMAVLRKYGAGEREQQEVLAAFWAMKDDVLHL